MGGMEFNKIFAAVLVAGIIAMLGGFVAKQVVHPHKLEKEAFPIEAMEETAGGAAAGPTGPTPILALIEAADVAKGEKIAKACAACHTFTKGGPAGVGPNLYGVVGGPKDHMPGFAYSGALLEVGGTTWTYAELGKFLYKPKAYAKNTKMSYAGLKKPEDRAALIAYLRSQADSPKAPPSAAEIAAEEAELAPPAAEASAEGESVLPKDGMAAAADAKAKAAETPVPAPAAH
jgi:cytochrome c